VNTSTCCPQLAIPPTPVPSNRSRADADARPKPTHTPPRPINSLPLRDGEAPCPEGADRRASRPSPTPSDRPLPRPATDPIPVNRRTAAGTRVNLAEVLAWDAVHYQPLLAVVRSDANGCWGALCQRRQPPKAGAVGQRLQRAAGQPSSYHRERGLATVSALWLPAQEGHVTPPFTVRFSPPPRPTVRLKSTPRTCRLNTQRSDGFYPARSVGNSTAIDSRSKTDAADAQAICEAVSRPSMRFVPEKSAAQQAALLHHRLRDLLVRQRTMLINALRGHLGEFGIIAPAGACR
jgi:Transposase